MPYDLPVVGYGGETVNTLRLWSAKATEEFDLEDFNRGEYVDAVENKVLAENLTKVLYPEAGFTKAQVIDYYVRIAPFLLPHYAKRPVTMKRFPDGLNGKAFYEKDAPKHTPDWVHTTDVPRVKGGKPGEFREVLIDRADEHDLFGRLQ